MASGVLTEKTLVPPKVRIHIPDTLTRIGKYVLYRSVALFFTVVIGVYLTVLIANMGGYLDTIRIAQIREQVGASVLGDPALQTLSASQLRANIDERVVIEMKTLNLDQPFFLRSINYLTDALTLNLGRAEFLASKSGSRLVRLILLERMRASISPRPLDEKPLKNISSRI